MAKAIAPSTGSKVATFGSSVLTGQILTARRQKIEDVQSKLQEVVQFASTYRHVLLKFGSSVPTGQI